MKVKIPLLATLIFLFSFFGVNGQQTGRGEAHCIVKPLKGTAKERVIFPSKLAFNVTQVRVDTGLVTAIEISFITTTADGTKYRLELYLPSSEKFKINAEAESVTLHHPQLPYVLTQNDFLDLRSSDGSFEVTAEIRLIKNPMENESLEPQISYEFGNFSMKILSFDWQSKALSIRGTFKGTPLPFFESAFDHNYSISGDFEIKTCPFEIREIQ